MLVATTDVATLVADVTAQAGVFVTPGIALFVLVLGVSVGLAIFRKLRRG